MTDETQKEPGFGWYRDKDNQFGAFWEHSEEGWRYFTKGEDDPEPGAWYAWAYVQEYAPFTPIDAPETKPDPMAEVRRQVALDFAVQLHASPNFKGGDVIEIAHSFEAYLKGGE